MKSSYDLLYLLNPFENYLQSTILNGKQWRLKTLFFSLFISFSLLFFFNKGYITQNFKSFYLDTVLKQTQPYFFWNSIVKQGQNPFSVNTYQYGSHESNRTFRLTIPLISRVFSLEGLGLFILQGILGCVFLYLLLSILEKILVDKLLVFYFFLAFINVYAGACFFLNCFGHGDGYTYFFILCSLLLRNPFILSIFLQLSFWADERSLITILGVYLFQKMYYQLASKRANKLLILISINAVLYLGIRLYLSQHFHLQAADVEQSSVGRFLEIAKSISNWWGARSYLGLEGFILLLIVLFLIQYHDKQRWFIIISTLYWLPILLVTFLVADTVRTLSFTFVFWLVSLFILKEKVSFVQLKCLFILIAFMNLLIPVIFP
jgi:hypothetical protein